VNSCTNSPEDGPVGPKHVNIQQYTNKIVTSVGFHSICIALLFLDQSTRRERGVSITPRPSITPGKTRYPLYVYRRLSRPQGPSGQVRKLSPPPEFNPRTVQPVARCYTDCATRPTSQRRCMLNNTCVMHSKLPPDDEYLIYLKHVKGNY